MCHFELRLELLNGAVIELNEYVHLREEACREHLLEDGRNATAYGRADERMLDAEITARPAVGSWLKARLLEKIIFPYKVEMNMVRNGPRLWH